MADQDEPGSDDLPMRTNKRFKHNYPYVIPAHHTPTRPQYSPIFEGAFPSSPLMASASPFESLTPTQVKKLEKQSRNIAGQVDFIENIVMRYTDERPNRTELLAKIGECLSSIPEMRSFSALTAKDFELLSRRSKRMIKVNEQMLLAKVPLELIPEWFWGAQHSYRSCLSRRMELGVRQIIGNFLVAAVEMARNLFSKPRLALHCEWDMPLTEIPEIGYVNGSVDFITAPILGQTDMEYEMDAMEGTEVLPEEPCFIVVEAKREQTYDSDRSKAQLLAQIMALSIRNGDSRTGALSDGNKWNFWHLHNDVWYVLRCNAKEKSEKHKLLALLTHFVAGEFPVPKSVKDEDIIFITESNA